VTSKQTSADADQSVAPKKRSAKSVSATKASPKASVRPGSKRDAKHDGKRDEKRDGKRGTTRAAGTTAGRMTAAKDQPFLPEAFVLWVKSTAWRSLGLLVIASAAATLLSLVSYSPADPSHNHLTDAPVTNWLGAFGAELSEFLMTALGLAAYGLSVTLALWGYKLIRTRWLPYFLINLVMLLISLPLLATALAAPQPHPDFPIQAGYGGAIGFLGYQKLQQVSVVAMPLPSWVWMLGTALVAVPLWATSFGLNRGEWAAIWRTKKAFWYSLWRGFLAVLVWIWQRFQPGEDMAEDTGVQDPKARRTRSTIARTDRDSPAPEPTKADVPARSPKVAAPPAPKRGQREVKERQGALDLGDKKDGFQLPALDLLNAPVLLGDDDRMSQDALTNNGHLLEGVLDDFNIKGVVGPIRPGPVVTLYELEPARGTKSQRVISLADDIARSMSAISARIAVIPGQNAIGIELPNVKRETVFLRELLASQTFEGSRAKLPVILGKDIGGGPIIADLATMPHLLVAGTTGSGKSVGVNAMILSLLYRYAPDELKLIMIDPKVIELSMYNDIPHLLTPVVTEAKKAVVALKWAVREMEDRYQMMQKLGVKNQSGFNKRVEEARERGEPLIRRVQTGFDPETGEPVYEESEFDFEPLPYLVIVIDEMADLMLVAGKDVEATVQRLAQMARAAGIHLIMATQRPSVDVITGTIKANFPTRISFQVTSKIDSRTILGEQGAEQLLGMGDMLYMAGGGRITRVHGAFVTDTEVDNVVAHLKRQQAPSYKAEVTEEPPEGFDSPFIPGPSDGGQDAANSLYDQAVAIVVRDKRPTISYIQRKLRIGYNRAAELIDEMEDQGVISAPNHKGQREILAPNHDEDYA